MRTTTRPVPLEAAMKRAERDYRALDAHRDRATLLATIASLDAEGMCNQDIADHVGLTKRSVPRLLAETPPTPAPLSTFDTSEARCRRLELTAAAACELACRLRDDDPRATWGALERLDRTHLQELTVVLLAAMPVDQPLSAALGWVVDLGAGAVAR